MKLEDVAHTILSTDKEGVVLISIEGFGGAGKSTLAESLRKRLPNSYVINIDDFIIKDRLSDRSADKKAFDRERLEKEVLIPVSQNHSAEYRKLIWEENTLSEPVKIPPVDYLIIEGISSYHPDIAKYYTYKIWVDTPMEIAKERGRARDGANENAQYWDIWAEDDLKYQEKYHPEQRADFIVENNNDGVAY